MTSKILIDTGPSDRGWHRIEAANRCLQYYAFRYEIRLSELGAAIPLVRGTIGHIGLAHYYGRIMAIQRGQDPDIYFDPLEAIDEKLRRWERESQTVYAVALALRDDVRKAIVAYMSEYAAERFRIWAVEHVVGMHFGRGRHRMTQRFDLVVIDDHENFWIWDHKFVSSTQAKTVRRYTLSGQFLEMVHQGVNQFGPKLAGIRINLVGIGKEKNETVITFKRASPEPAPWALREFPAHVDEGERRIAAQKEAGTPLWEYPKALSELVCEGPYGSCEAKEACRTGPPL